LKKSGENTNIWKNLSTIGEPSSNFLPKITLITIKIGKARNPSIEIQSKEEDLSRPMVVTGVKIRN